MGLYEKAKNLTEAQLRALFEPGAPVSEARLRALILDVDRYRRDLVRSLAERTNEEAYLARQLADRSAQLALWRARRELARERGREELAREAEAREKSAEVARASIERSRAQLATEIAKLRAGLDRVERTLRLLRKKRRSLEPHPAAALAPEDAAAAAAAETPAPPLAGPDLVEEEFQRLEHEEVTREIGRRRKPAGPESEPPAEPTAPPPRASER
jgi:phage shock protein A